MSAAALNAIVSPWFVRTRPAALAMAYNGGSIGGVIFSPLWVAAVDVLGFPAAAAMIGLVAILTMWALARLGTGAHPAANGFDARRGCAWLQPQTYRAARRLRRHRRACRARGLWRDWKFLTLCGRNGSGPVRADRADRAPFLLASRRSARSRPALMMGLATALAIAGRTVRRLADACRRGSDAWPAVHELCGAGCGLDRSSCLAAGTSIPLLLLGHRAVRPGLRQLRRRCRR